VKRKLRGVAFHHTLALRRSERQARGFSQALDKKNNRRGLAISFGTEEAAVIDFSLSDYQN